MTAGELLALDARGDKRLVLIHMENTGGNTTLLIPPADPADMEQWESDLLEASMVSWEANNAKYLLEKVGARLVTPLTFASMVQPVLLE